MGISVDWRDNTESLLHVRFEDDWNVNDFTEAIRRAYSRIKRVENQVDLVLNFSDPTTPAGKTLSRLTVSSASRMNTAVPENRRHFVIVGGDSYLRAVIGMLGRIMPRFTENVLYADSFEEALQMIENGDA
jgi:hypothetical protein